MQYVVMRSDKKFLPVSAFNTTSVGSTGFSYALETTAHSFLYPSNRSVRLVNDEAYYVQFGTSDAVADTNSFLVPSLGRAIFRVEPRNTHVAFLSTSSAIINVTLGMWGEGETYTGTAATSTEVPSTEAIFTIQEAASVEHVYWLDELASWTIGDAAHILGMYHYSTST